MVQPISQCVAMVSFIGYDAVCDLDLRARNNGKVLAAIFCDQHIVLNANTAKILEALQLFAHQILALHRTLQRFVQKLRM